MNYFINVLQCVQVNKEEDDKMRTTAANVAARAAVGGDDMLSKWQMMAEQAKQKREGGVEGSSSKDVSHSKPLENVKEHQEIEKRTHPPVATFGTLLSFFIFYFILLNFKFQYYFLLKVVTHWTDTKSVMS